MTAPTPTVCPNCSAPATGHFCANCGVSLDGSARCAGCGTSLTPGAKFCHRCGTPAGTTPAPGAMATAGATGSATRSPAAGAAPSSSSSGERLPWAVAAIALLTVVALVAGQNFRAQRPGSTLDAPSNALPQAGLDDRAVGQSDAAQGDAPFAGGGGDAAAAPPLPAGRAPDISSMTPAERASRLFDRVMRYDEQGKRDSLATFAPMAIAAYESLDALDADQRYDLGRIGEVSGNYRVAKAQADTILRARPTHLLGLLLAARMSPDPKVARDYERRLLDAAPSELRTPLPEYQRHRTDIERALAAAKEKR